MFYFIATICFLINANQIVMDAGYGIVNFVYLYCFGYYIRNYYDDTHNTILYIGIYFFACSGTYIVNLIMSEIVGFYFDSMISYNTIFTLSGSVGLFMWFKQLHWNIFLKGKLAGVIKPDNKKDTALGQNCWKYCNMVWNAYRSYIDSSEFVYCTNYRTSYNSAIYIMGKAQIY